MQNHVTYSDTISGAKIKKRKCEIKNTHILYRQAMEKALT